MKLNEIKHILKVQQMVVFVIIIVTLLFDFSSLNWNYDNLVVLSLMLFDSLL